MMESASIQFIAFGLLVALVSRASAAPAWRMAVLLVANAAFLLLLGATPLTIAPLASFLLAGYLSIRLVAGGHVSARGACLALLIVVYAWLKRYVIFPPATLLPFVYLTVGLSYIFFRVLHLVIEAGEEGPVRRMTTAEYLAYTLNVTTLVSGPIQRFEEYRSRRLAPPSPLTPAVVGAQVERIVIGFFKVNVVALLLDMIHVDALAQLGTATSPGERALALFRLAAAYPFFLYCNFSGYIDIVIALARLIGLELPENFDRPFLSRSAIEFWTRWHITLSTWLKTYVYNPLLTFLLRHNRIAALEQTFGVLCFFVTFFLVGIWHGRTSEFVVFGVLQGGGVALNKVWQIVLARRLGKKPYKALQAQRLYADLSRGLTFTWFALTMVWFWARWGTISTVLTAVDPPTEVAVWGALWIVSSVVLALWFGAWERVRTSPRTAALAASPYTRTVCATTLAAIAFFMVAVISQPAPGIVYRTF